MYMLALAGDAAWHHKICPPHSTVPSSLHATFDHECDPMRIVSGQASIYMTFPSVPRSDFLVGRLDQSPSSNQWWAATLLRGLPFSNAWIPLVLLLVQLSHSISKPVDLDGYRLTFCCRPVKRWTTGLPLDLPWTRQILSRQASIEHNSSPQEYPQHL